MRRMGATCTAAQTHMHSQRIPSQEFDRSGAESGGVDALPSEWRPWLRSDRLLGSPGADRQGFGCSPAIEGISIQYPPKHARFSDHMSGRNRASTCQPDVGISRRVRRQPGGETEQRWCDVVVTQGRAVCTHGMRLGGSHRRLGNGGCRQEVHRLKYCAAKARKRRTICIAAGPCGRSTAYAANWALANPSNLPAHGSSRASFFGIGPP